MNLVLGTVQLGLEYGIQNTLGKPSYGAALEIIHLALSHNVRFFDTARAYGNSESILGDALQAVDRSKVTVITKLDPLSSLDPDAGLTDIKIAIGQSVYNSCRSLQTGFLDVLMLHRVEHLTKWNGAVWREVCGLKKAGLVRKLGVSLQTPEETLLSLSFKDIDFIQLPFNILDYRWDMVIKTILQVRRLRPLVIHARSALLQGLLATGDLSSWKRARCTNAVEVVDWLSHLADIYTNGDVVSLCIQYVCSQTWVDGIVIGVETKEQLLKNFTAIGREGFPSTIVDRFNLDRPLVPAETLNPTMWL